MVITSMNLYDFSEVNNLEIIDAEVIKKTLKFFEVDELGLETL